MPLPQSRYDLPRIIFGVLFIAIMIVACFWVIQPFILGFAWAGMVVIATGRCCSNCKSCCGAAARWRCW